MFSNIVTQFENITKFALLQYFEDYRDFMQNDFSYISEYYNGDTSSIDASHISNFNALRTKSKTLMQQFINFSHRLSNCGFWELQEYCQDLNDVLEKITKLPKYYRTSKTVRGYQPYIQVKSNIGGLKTVQDLAQEINSEGVSEISLIIDNDLQEKDWDIDELSSITAFVNNQTDVVVETILEQPIGNQIYGKDINRKITLENNDLAVKKYEDNVEQKCDILLSLERGNIPEMPNFGKNRLQGTNMSDYNYTELVKDLQSVFLQNDLFEDIEISDIEYKQGDIFVNCTIKTKYSYSTQKTLKI
jgi:hypothetical protein